MGARMGAQLVLDARDFPLFERARAGTQETGAVTVSIFSARQPAQRLGQYSP